MKSTWRLHGAIDELLTARTQALYVPGTSGVVGVSDVPVTFSSRMIRPAPVVRLSTWMIYRIAPLTACQLKVGVLSAVVPFGVNKSVRPDVLKWFALLQRPVAPAEFRGRIVHVQ